MKMRDGKHRFNRIVLLSIVLLLSVMAGFAVKLGNEKSRSTDNDIDISEYTRKQFLTEEFGLVEGVWEISEYLGMAVEVAVYEDIGEEKENAAVQTDIISNKYLGKVLRIEESNIEALSPSTELGYHIDDDESLFFIFRQPSSLNINSPYICVSVKLKTEEEVFNIIFDSDREAVLYSNSCFFSLKKVPESDCRIESFNEAESISEIITGEKPIFTAEDLPEEIKKLLSYDNWTDNTRAVFSDMEELQRAGMAEAFQLILSGDFSKVEGLRNEEEREELKRDYEEREKWEYTLQDMNRDDIEELCMKDGKGRIGIFYTTWGDSIWPGLIGIWSLGEAESNLLTEEGKWGMNTEHFPDWSKCGSILSMIPRQDGEPIMKNRVFITQ